MVEGITYQQALQFAHSWGALYFVLMFAVACAYAYWPANQKTFKDAASMALDKDDGAP
jgi:cytochrome c oxidase cbb3-type subunit 4